MKFQTLLEDLLNELSGKEIYQKYYSKLPYDEFLTIVRADPQTVYEDGELKKMGKYSKLLVALYQKGGIRLDDVDKANEYLGYVYTHKIALDVNKVKQLSDLYDVVKGYIVQDTKNLEEILKILPQEEYKVLHNGDNWYMFQPLTEKASCYLGVNTEWCTTWGPYSLNKKHRDRGNHFTSHSNRGPLYIMINKNDPNDKYQFHFETNQFMDKNDRRINTGNFLTQRNNKELLYYFFPSIIKDVSPEQIKIELKRIDVLPSDLGMKIFEKSIGQINNNLVNAIIQKDNEVVGELLPGAGDMNITDGKVTFTVDEIKDDVEQLEQNLNWYNYESDHGWEYIYDDVRDRGMDEYEKDKLKEFLSDYYKENQDIIRSSVGVNNFDGFLSYFFDDYVSSDNIQESFWSEIADLSYSTYEEANLSKVKEIQKDIYISGGYAGEYDITLNMVKFIQFLLRKDIESIEDEDLFHEMLGNYIDYCGHGGEFERIYDYNITYPKYGNNSSLSNTTDKYFDEIFEDSETGGQCMELRKKFNDIIQKYFKNSTTYQNEHIIVRLQSKEIDCKTGMVKVEYTNKDTGETYGGWRDKNDGVKIDNLVSLMTNYKLFEDLVRFKKNALPKEIKEDDKNKKESGEKFITCVNCKSKFTQTIHKGKKSLPICPKCGTKNQDT